MSRFSSFRDVVNAWPTRDALAKDVGANLWLVLKWPQRDWIPAEWWLALLKTKTAREVGLTAEDLLRLASGRRLP